MTPNAQNRPLDRRQFVASAAALGIVSRSVLATAEEQSHAPIRVLTYNIRYDNPADGENGWKHRRDEMARFVAAEKFDLAGLQEVLIGQARDLEERLPAFNWYGVGRDDGKNKGELSPIFYAKERFERVEAGTFWLSAMPDNPGSKGWDAALPRICSWVKLRDRQSGREFHAFNTHFDHQGELARKRSATLLRAKIPQIAGTGPAILTGDFNCTATEDPYKMLTSGQDSGGDRATPPLKDAQFVSEARPSGPDSTWNGFQEIVPGRKIDFIFVQQARVQSHGVLDPRTSGRFLSDHLPVVSEVVIEPAKK